MSMATLSAPQPPKTFFDERPSTQKQESRDDKFDIWSSIQASKAATGSQLTAPYVHPLVRRSSSSLSQRSLEICTESLGSETGSDGFSDVNDYFSSSPHDNNKTFKELDDDIETQGDIGRLGSRKEFEAVNYHCSIGGRSQVRTFPPPLPSISRRDGPCVHMRPHRRDGRLVVEAVPVPSQNYLHCQRRDGRLLLSFIETTFDELYPEIQAPSTPKHAQEQKEEQEVDVQEQEREEKLVKEEEEGEEEEEQEEEEGEGEGEGEEQVEVVDRGIVVEVKVSRGMKVHKSSLVINKFVSGIPLLDNKVEAKETDHDTNTTIITTNNIVGNGSNGTTVKASIEEVYGWGTGGQKRQQQQQASQDNKLLFISKKLMNRQALLHQVRRCSYHHRPLFIWERCCIATS